jgi:hypothetical protein
MSKKNKMWDNSNLQEDIVWGNIELPGVSDETLLTTNWNYVDAAKSRMANPKTRNKLSVSITEKQNKKEYLEHMSRQRNQAMDKPIDDSGITLREKLTISNQISAKNPEHHANRCKANAITRTTTKWKEAHAKGVLSYSEETMTPMGVYPSMSQWLKENNKPGGRSFLKSLPHLFYQTKDGPGKPTYERIYYTPFGACASEKHCYSLCRENKEVNSLKLRNIGGWWLKMATLHPKQYFIKFEKACYWPIEKNIPFGMQDLESKPRIAHDKVKSVESNWRQRLKHHRTLYKK